MKAVTFTCDRCGTTAAAEWEVHIIEGFKTAMRSGWEPRPAVGDWHEFADDEKVEDVCPDCLTVVERAEWIVAQSEDIPF